MAAKLSATPTVDLCRILGPLQLSATAERYVVKKRLTAKIAKKSRGERRENRRLLGENRAYIQRYSIIVLQRAHYVL